MASSIPYKDSRVWQSSMQLAVDMYQLTAGMPPSERLGLCANLQQAATAIPTAIAAGSTSRGALLKACQSAHVSAAELETLLTIAGQAYPNIPTNDALDQLDEVRSLLASLAKRLSASPPKQRKAL